VDSSGYPLPCSAPPGSNPRSCRTLIIKMFPAAPSLFFAFDAGTFVQHLLLHFSSSCYLLGGSYDLMHMKSSMTIKLQLNPFTEGTNPTTLCSSLDGLPTEASSTWILVIDGGCFESHPESRLVRRWASLWVLAHLVDERGDVCFFGFFRWKHEKNILTNFSHGDTLHVSMGVSTR